jgi:signal transduction histidine kinase
MRWLQAKRAEDNIFIVFQLILVIIVFGLTTNNERTSGVGDSTITSWLLFLILIVGVVATWRCRRRVAQQFHEINELKSRLTGSLKTVTDLDTQTRRELAEWMHGEIQHAIFHVGKTLQQSGLDEAIAELAVLNEKIARGGALKLYPMQLEISLGLALADLCAGRAELIIPRDLSFASMGKLDGLVIPFDLRLAIYRIIQEGINNAEKKGTVTQITVSLETVGTSIQITVFDNGHSVADIYSPSFGLRLIDAYTNVHQGSWKLSNVANGVALTAVFSDALHPVREIVPQRTQELRLSL